MKPLLVALCVGFAFGSLSAQTRVWQPSPGHTQVPRWRGADVLGQTECASVTRYYITARALLYEPAELRVFGASNLPNGAVVTLYVSDYLGKGSTALTEGATAIVGADGLFNIAVHPKRGATFRKNAVSSVTFVPNDPVQPRTVAKIIGRHGEHLGAFPSNPEIREESGVRMLALDVVVE